MNTSPQGSGPARRRRSSCTGARRTSVVQERRRYRTGVVNYTGGSFPEQLRSGTVSRRLLQAVRRAGRARPDVSAPRRICRTAGKAVVLSHGTWTTRFNSDPQIVGKAISLGGEPYTVVGVLGDFDFAEFGPAPQVWTPFQLDPNTTDQGHYFQAAGRLEAGRHARAGARRACSCRREEFRRKYPDGARARTRASASSPCKNVLVRNVRTSLLRARRRRQLRAADRVRERREPADGARDRPQARDCDARRARRLARPHRAPAAHRERRAVARSAACSGWRSAWSAFARCCRSTRPDCRASASTARSSASTGACSPSRSSSSLGTGVLFGLFPAFQSARTDLTTTLKESGGRSGTGFRQNKARSMLVVVRSGAGADSARRVGAADPHGGRARRRRSRVRARNVLTMRMSLHGPAVPQVRERRAGGARRRRAPAQACPASSSASATCCVPLEGGYGLAFVDSRPAAAARRAVPRRRPVDDRLAGLLRGLQDSREARPRVQRARQQRRAGRRHHQRGDGEAVLAGRRSAERAARDRPRRHARVRDRSPSARSSASSATRATAGSNSEPGPAMYIPQAQVPDAVNALNVRIAPMAWVVRTAGRSASAEQPDPGTDPAGDRTAGDQRPIDGGSRARARPRGSASTCG